MPGEVLFDLEKARALRPERKVSAASTEETALVNAAKMCSLLADQALKIATSPLVSGATAIRALGWSDAYHMMAFALMSEAGGLPPNIKAKQLNGQDDTMLLASLQLLGESVRRVMRYPSIQPLAEETLRDYAMHQGGESDDSNE